LVALTVLTIVTISVMDGEPGVHEIVPEADPAPETQFTQDDIDLAAELRRMSNYDAHRDAFENLSGASEDEFFQEQEKAVTAADQGDAAAKANLHKGAVQKGAVHNTLKHMGGKLEHQLQAEARRKKKEAKKRRSLSLLETLAQMSDKVLREDAVPSKKGQKQAKKQPEKTSKKQAKKEATKAEKMAKQKQAQKKAPAIDLSHVTEMAMHAAMQLGGDDDDNDASPTPVHDEDEDEFAEGIAALDQSLIRKRSSYSHLAKLHPGDTGTIEDEEKDVLSKHTDVLKLLETSKRPVKKPFRAVPLPTKVISSPIKPAVEARKVAVLRVDVFEEPKAVKKALRSPSKKVTAKAKKAKVQKKAAKKPCVPPFCLPSGLETSRREKAKAMAKKHPHVVKKAHTKVHKTLSFEERIEALDRTKPDLVEQTQEAQRKKAQEAAAAKKQARAAKKKAKEAKRRAEQQAKLHEAQTRAHKEAVAEVKGESERWAFMHGIDWDDQKGKAKAGKELEHAVSKATQEHLAKDAMEAALNGAAEQATTAADVESGHQGRRAADMHSLMDELLKNDIHDAEQGERHAAKADAASKKHAKKHAKQPKVDYAKLMADKLLAAQRAAMHEAHTEDKQHHTAVQNKIAEIAAKAKAKAKARTAATKKALRALQQDN